MSTTKALSLLNLEKLMDLSKREIQKKNNFKLEKKMLMDYSISQTNHTIFQESNLHGIDVVDLRNINKGHRVCFMCKLHVRFKFG